MCEIFSGQVGKGPMKVATEIIPSKYMVGQRRSWEEIYV